MGIQIGGMSGGGGGAGGDALTTNPLSQFAATTSAQLRGVISDETGSGLAVFNDSPTLITPTLGAALATTLTTTGQILNGLTTTNAASYSFVGDTDTGWGYRGADQLTAVCGGSEVFRLSISVAYFFANMDATTNTAGASAGGKLGLGTGFVFDSFIARDAANVFAQRNSTAAQKNRVYNTFTTLDTAGEWFKQDWQTTANQFRFGAVKGSSTGTARVATWDYGGVEATPTAAITVPVTSGSIVFGGGITLPDAGDVVINTTTGTKLGTATSQKLGLWNVTPIIQPAAAGQAAITDSTGGTPASSLVDVGVVFSQSAINANFATTAVLLLAMRTAMVNSGLMKGAA